MSWITVIWSMNAGACLTLAAFYGAGWSKQREKRVYLLFSCGAAAAAVISAFELWMMHARTVEQYQLLVRWIHLPTWVLIVSFVAAMAYELSSDMAQAARLTRELELSEKRFNLAADSANFGMWEWDLEKANGTSLPVSAPVAAQLYRIAQEAVRNAVEHGAAREVLIQLMFGHRGMPLTVQDGGEGFDTKTNGHGMGLRIMRYRAQRLGGSCEVHTGASKGTTVYCRVPLEAQPSISTIS